MIGFPLAAMLMLMIGGMQTPAVPANDDFVQLERSECFWSCPAYTVRVYEDGRVTWQGIRSVLVTGAAVSRIAPEVAHALLQKFNVDGFRSLNPNYSRPIDDLPSFVTTAHIGSMDKRVSNQAQAAPVILQNLENEIDVVADTHHWIHGDPRAELMTGLNIVADGAAGKPGVTPLMKAAITADTLELQKLLTAKADPNAGDSSGWTALVYAARGVKPGREDAETFSSGTESVKMLLDAGADPNLRSSMGQTPIMSAVAAYYSPFEKTKLLIDAKADVNVQDKNGQTVMMQFVRGALGRSTNAMYQQQLDILSMLRTAGAQTDLKDTNGFTVFDLLNQELQRAMTTTLPENDKAAMRTQQEKLRKVLQD